MLILDSRIINALDMNSSNELIHQVNFPEPNGEYDIFKSNILFSWTHRGSRKKSAVTNDVSLFIDYLVYGLESEEKLNNIIGNIEQEIYSDNSIYSKFRWVADYLLDLIEHHQSFLDDFIDYTILKKNSDRLKNL